MAHIDAIEAARPLYRPHMHSKSDGVALPERYNFGPRLHPRPLFGQDELATFEITTGFRQQNRDLQREHVLAIEVLMKAVIVTFAVLQQQRRRPRLARVMASLQ